jgi:hypothetical protein
MHITQRLIAEKGYSALAVEADWPDAHLQIQPRPKQAAVSLTFPKLTGKLPHCCPPAI